MMGAMERGFGWHYPPGTPGPHSEQAQARCLECDEVQTIETYWELGSTEWIPAECPLCGGSWSDDLEPMEPPEPDYDRLYEMERNDGPHD